MSKPSCEACGAGFTTDGPGATACTGTVVLHLCNTTAYQTRLASSSAASSVDRGKWLLFVAEHSESKQGSSCCMGTSDLEFEARRKCQPWFAVLQRSHVSSHRADLSTLSFCPFTVCQPGFGGDGCSRCPNATFSVGGNTSILKPACKECGIGSTTDGPGAATCSGVALLLPHDHHRVNVKVGY